MHDGEKKLKETGAYPSVVPEGSKRLFEKSDKSASRAAAKMYFEHFSNRL